MVGWAWHLTAGSDDALLLAQFFAQAGSGVACSGAGRSLAHPACRLSPLLQLITAMPRFAGPLEPGRNSRCVRGFTPAADQAVPAGAVGVRFAVDGACFAPRANMWPVNHAYSIYGQKCPRLLKHNTVTAEPTQYT